MATGFSIDTFRSKALVGSGARANLFDVEMTGVPGMASSTDITYTCKAAQIPGSAVTAIDVPYFGRIVKVPGNKTFENWSVTILNDESFSVRNVMEKWIASMGSHKENKVAAGGLQYGQAKVMQYAKVGGSAIHTYTFVNIFPVSVAAIDLAWDSNDAIEDFAVEFAYDYWTSLKDSTAIVT